MKKIFIANAELTKPLLPNIHGKRNIPLYRYSDGLSEYVATVEVMVLGGSVYMLVSDAILTKFTVDDPELEWDYRLYLELDMKVGGSTPRICGELIEINEES